MELKVKYNNLIESLYLLSLPFKEQEKAVPDFVLVYDEVISSFEDAFLLTPSIIESEILSYSIIANVIRCYNLMEMNLRTESPTYLEDFKSGSSWNKIRIFAGKIHKEIINNTTITKLHVLNNEERVNEIAEMIGGKNHTKTAITQAMELLN